MVVYFTKTLLIIQCILLSGCFFGCKEAERTSYERPLKTKLPKHYIISKTEKLNERIVIRVNPVYDSVYSDHVSPFNVAFINLSTDTVSILTGSQTLKIEAIQDSSTDSRIKLLESQMDMKILISDVQDFIYTDVAKGSAPKSAFNKTDSRAIILPKDSLSETVNFNFTTRAGKHRPFRLIYDTENYELLIDTTKIKIPVPLLATGKVSSDLFYIDVLEPVKSD